MAQACPKCVLAQALCLLYGIQTHHSWHGQQDQLVGDICCLKNRHQDRPTAVFPKRVRSTEVWAAGEEQQQIELTLPNLN